MLSAIAATRAGRSGSEARSWSSTISAERRERVAGVALDLGRLRRRGRARSACGARSVHEAERDAGVGGVRERALALDEEELSPTLRALDDQPLRGARDEVRDHGVDGDAPAGDRDSGLPGRDELRPQPTPLSLPVELDRHGLLADRAVRADGQDGLRVEPQVLAGRDVEIGRRLAEVAELDSVLGRRARRARRPREMNSCRPLSRSSPASIEAFRSSRQAGGKRPPCVATPTRAVVGSYGKRIGDRCRRSGSPCASPPRAASRGWRPSGAGCSRRRRASSSRNGRRPTSPQRGSGTASRTPSPGLSEGSWTPSTSSTPGHGS